MRSSFKHHGISQLVKIKKGRCIFPVVINALKPLSKCLPFLLDLCIQPELSLSWGLIVSWVSQFSHSIVSSSLRNHGLQHFRPPCPSKTPRAYSKWVTNHLILYWPFLLPPPIFPSIRVFSIESVLSIRWPKYWSFSFSISLSNEYLRLISFRMDWLDLLAVQGLSRVFSSTTVQKNKLFGTQPFLYSSSHIHTWLLEKP